MNGNARRWAKEPAAQDDRGTNPEIFEDLARRHGPFTVDVAAAAHNAKCARFYDLFANGLSTNLGHLCPEEPTCPDGHVPLAGVPA